MRRITGLVGDYPFATTLLIVALVGAHFVASILWPEVNVASALARTRAGDEQALLSELSIGVAGVSAMVGGFAGVVVVFGLGTETDHFRLLRTSGGSRLRANWLSVVMSSFAAAFGAVLAAVTVVAFDATTAMWILELCLLISAHAALRLTALLAGLAGLVDEQDAQKNFEERKTPIAGLIPPKR